MHFPSSYLQTVLTREEERCVKIHRRSLREIDVVSLMPRYVYINLFDSKHFIARPLEGAQQIIYHATLYPCAVPNPVIKELVNIAASLI